MKIGLISDTHDYLDPRVARRFSRVSHILHAGDIGSPTILSELELIAPVTAVGGNTDDPFFLYRETQFVELGGRKFFMRHIINPISLDAELIELIDQKHPDVVLFGHTHKQFTERIRNVLFLNPGYSGKPRDAARRSVAVLDCDDKAIIPQFLAL